MTDTPTPEEEIVLVEVDQLPDPNAPKPELDAPAEDEEDHEDEPEEDARLAESEEGEPKQRERRLKRREAQKAAKARAEAEIRMLRETVQQQAQRLEAVEKNTYAHNATLIDARLTDAKSRVAQAETIIARAVEAGNGDDVAAAMRLRDTAKFEADNLEQAKTKAEQTQNAPPASNPVVANLGAEWMAANPWFDPRGGNEESAITNTIDARLLQEGYNPADRAYWQELTRRVASRLAPAQKEAPVTTAKKTPPPMGASRENAPASTRREVYVTPERKQAMIDAGYWDDPVKRNKMLAAYSDHDKNNASRTTQ